MNALRDQFPTEQEYARAEPLPLFGEKPLAQAYPVDALGPVLGAAVRSAVEYAQVPTSLAAQSTLAACSLTLQGLCNVELPTGQVRPISLFLITVADSGDRKSTTDEFVSKPIRDFEKELEDRYSRERESASNAQAAWAETKKNIIARSKKNASPEYLKECLDELGPCPNGAIEPTLIVRTGTTQGLLKRFMTTRPSLGLMSDEGGSWIGGYGMTEDNRLNTISTLSDFWDGKTIQTLTSSEGYTPLRGKRLTFHMMVQPIVADRLLGNAEAMGQGFLSRMLVCHPESLAGTRFNTGAPRLDPGLSHYNQQLARALRATLPVEPETNNLNPRTLEMSDDAKLAWFAFYNDTEGKIGRHGELESIKGFVAKLPEQAARIAANLALIEQGSAVQCIEADDMSRGIELARFYMSEALRLFGSVAPSSKKIDAQVLSDWLKDSWKEPLISIAELAKKAPRRLRSQGTDHLKALVEILEQHDHLAFQPNGGVVGGKKARTAWRVMVRDA